MSGSNYMSSNKKAREELERMYGRECFIEKLHLRKDDKQRVYKTKGQFKRMKQLTFHHIVERRKGGKATVLNGALLSNENHIWFHQQSESVQGYMNAIFQEYKKQSDECKVVFVDKLNLPYKVIPTCIVLDEKNDKNYNRAKEKQKTYELSKEYLDR